jgi:hypothetical protein
MATGTNRRDLSASNRHSLRNADAEIAHLERALAADGARSIFAQTYWRRRLHEIHATPGLGIHQRISWKSSPASWSGRRNGTNSPERLGRRFPASRVGEVAKRAAVVGRARLLQCVAPHGNKVCLLR